MSAFKAEAIVVQCGADCLTGDPLGNSNLTEIALGECIKDILKYKLPTIFLGGGIFSEGTLSALVYNL
jgi:acetoin utilization deacetylase AcuC-like enzyme